MNLSFCFKHTEPFREKVDYEALGLLDYPTIVKKPMDLGTVRNKLTAKEYSSLYQVAEDVRLVWNNCMTYNADGSDFYLLAQSLSKKWGEKYAKLLQDFGLVAPTNIAAKENSLTLEEKRQFAKNLYKISKEDVGQILVELDEKCPSALVKNSAEDEFELNIDKISGPVFSELNAFVQSALQGKKKKASSSSSSSKKQKT